MLEGMDDASRSCHRPGCCWPAAATLSYRYATRQVWLLDLSPATDPSLYDLCPQHADALTVPRGWDCVDERRPPPAEPTGDERIAAARRQAAQTSSGADRYARLREELPGVAARLATGPYG